ncbi:MAG: hypothetical protein V7750_06540 [Sneathiella sp.]
MINRSVIFGAMAAIFTFSSTVVFAEECQDKELVKAGAITGEGGSVGFIIGYRWGAGEITLNDGRKFNFKVKGGKIGEIGANKVSFAGTIYNMKTIDDFAGVYSGVAAGITLYKGLGGASFTNPRCVSINVKRTDSTGLQSSLPAPAVLDVELVK